MSARKTINLHNTKTNEDNAGSAIGADNPKAAGLSTCFFEEENRAGRIDAAGRSPGTKDGHGVHPPSPGAQESSMRETAAICAPDDCEHGAAAASRLYGRTSDENYRYAAADGATAFYVCRWVQPDGQTNERTLSWRPGVGWIFRAWAGGRPLYRLEEILTDEQAQVMICASEPAADAAAKLFPDCAVTCSSGATLEAAKSDWTPLAGRNIVIWPNNDDVSRAFANEVATTLAAINCVVSIIDATALAAIEPGGGVQEPQENWGAADAILDWADTKALCTAARVLAKPFKRPLAYASYGRFNMTSAGLYASIEKGSGENRGAEKVWVCDPFEILGASRDPDGCGWGKELRLHDSDGREHRIHIADATLHRSGQVCQSLAHMGLQVQGNYRSLLVEYLAGARIDGRVTRVARTGWHEIGRKAIFVLPNKIIGACGAEMVTLDAAAHGPYEARGSLQEWRDGVATLAGGHVLPVLAISAALAGPLLAFAGVEGGGLHFHGPSSTGKTTIATLSASVWGRGGSPGYIRSWLSTANAIEGAASAASDTALILDELGQADASAAAAALYSLANGAGKSRANNRGELITPRTWRLMVVSTGELPVETKLGEDHRRKPRAGQMVRMLNIPVDREFGAFDHAGADGDAAKFARRCQQAATTAFGVAGPEFVRLLIDSGVTGKVVRDGIAAFVRDHVPPKSDGQIDRAAQRLGMIAFAGELAIRFGITPWRQGEAVAAAAWALAEWIARRGGIEPAEVINAIEQARAFVACHGAARFEDLDDPDGEPVRNRAGWRKGGEWWVLPNIWRTEVCDGLDPVVVARALAERGMLRRQGGDNLQCTVNVGGTKRARVYVLTADLMDVGETED